MRKSSSTHYYMQITGWTKNHEALRLWKAIFNGMLFCVLCCANKDNYLKLQSRVAKSMHSTVPLKINSILTKVEREKSNSLFAVSDWRATKTKLRMFSHKRWDTNWIDRNLKYTYPLLRRDSSDQKRKQTFLYFNFLRKRCHLSQKDTRSMMFYWKLEHFILAK